jgi:hypothetical protein
MNHAEHKLVSVCDDLLRAIKTARSLEHPISAPVATILVDRILDVRNILSPPKPQTAKPS